MSTMVVDHCPTLEFYGFVLDGHISPTNIDPGTRIKSSRKASEEE
jgi:hypothetical protein